MTETNSKVNKNWTSGLAEAKNLTKLKGTLTSPIQLRGENTPEPYYYSFIRLKGQKVDLPVIFKVKSVAFKTKELDNRILEPDLKKGTELELSGHYSSSLQNVRKSFTCLDYQILDKKIKKECFGCGDKFTCSQSKDYDYCTNCAINGSRYIPGRFTKNNCPECGDGSGTIQFSNQPPRNCKTCYLVKVAILDQAKKQLPLLKRGVENIAQIRQQLESHE